MRSGLRNIKCGEAEERRSQGDTHRCCAPSYPYYLLESFLVPCIEEQKVLTDEKALLVVACSSGSGYMYQDMRFCVVCIQEQHHVLFLCGSTARNETC